MRKKVTKDELVQGIYSLGVNQYNHLIQYFKERNIIVENNQLFFQCQLIISRIAVMVFKNKNYKNVGNLTDEIIELLFDSISPDTSTKDKEIIHEYILMAKDEINDIVGKGDTKILDLVSYFLGEILSELSLDYIQDHELEVFLVNLFDNWQNICFELVSKFKVA